MTSSKQTIQAQQKSQILDHLDDEWYNFLDRYIRMQESIYDNFSKPTNRQEILEDKKWARDLTKLVSLYAKLVSLDIRKKEKDARYKIKLYTWQKPPSKQTITKLALKQRKTVDEYYKLKIDFLKQFPLEQPL